MVAENGRHLDFGIGGPKGEREENASGEEKRIWKKPRTDHGDAIIAIEADKTTSFVGHAD
jgi:hypothetical protein